MIRLMLTVLTLLMNFNAASQETQSCNGDFSVQFNAQHVEFKKEGNISAWIPGVVELQGALKECVKTLNFVSISTNQIQLQGGGHTLEGQLFDESYRSLSSSSQEGYALPLSSNGSTLFWLRLPSAGFSPAGKYIGRLEAKLVGLDEMKSRTVDIEFHSLPLVSMKVPSVAEPWLSQSGNNYRVDMGEMTLGSTRNIILAIRSNASVSIEISSKHGYLQHQSLPKQHIDYQLKLNGTSWDPKITFVEQLGYLQRNRYTYIPFTIMVAPQPRAFAGLYSDRLTIMVTAN
ncbi:hypothetical protein LCL85_12430 [Vibrio alginolyticus]|nr:hypothetical protein [Vibrio alginolyticus]